MNEIIVLIIKIAVPLIIIAGLIFIGRFIARKHEKLSEKIVSPIITLFIFLLMVILFTQTSILSGLEWGAIDFRFYMRDPSQKSVKLEEGVKMNKINPRARKDIVIIGIDEETINDFSNQGIQWPFPWEKHAKLTKYISTGKPNAILYDIMFLDHKPGEAELAKALKDSKVAFIDYKFDVEEVNKQLSDHVERMELLSKGKFPVDPKDHNEQIVDAVTPPTPELMRSAKGVGFANVFPGRDSINRMMPLIIKYKGAYYPNIDLSIVMHYYGIGLENVEIKIGKYQVEEPAKRKNGKT